MKFQPKTISRKNISWLLVAAIIFLNTLGMTIVFPVLPFIIEHQLADKSQLALWVGIIEAVTFACAFISAPILGAFSDHWGRKPILVISMLGSVVGYALFGIGGSIWVLILARVIDGFTAGDQPVLFAYIADSYDKHERAKRYGFLGALSGVGFLVGPAIGGFLASISLSAPVFATAGLALLVALISWFVLPESLPLEKRSKKPTLQESHPLSSIKDALSRKGLRPLLISLVLITVPFAFFTSNVSVLALDSVQWGPSQIGLLLSAIGVLDIIIQGGLLGLLMKRFGEHGVVLAGIITQAIGIVFLIGAASLFRYSWVLAAGSLIMASGEGGMSAALQGLVSGAVDETEQGKIAGAVTSLSTAVQMAGPLLAGWLYVSLGHASPYVLGLFFIIAAGWQFMRMPKSERRPQEQAS